MATRIRHRRSSVPGLIPSPGDLEAGELAINTYDGKIYLKTDDSSVQDITRKIFLQDTKIEITDSSDGIITMVVDAQELIRLSDNGIDLKENVQIEDGKSLTFRELQSNGAQGVTVKAPDSLATSYTLTLPTAAGTLNQVLSVDGNGQLRFSDADAYGGNRIYVSSEMGNDANDGVSAPVATIKKALQLASSYVYTSGGAVNGIRIAVMVAAGNYVEDNPIIIPDNVSVIGDGLRTTLVRPLNPGKDMFRVRNGCYFTEFTFRDAVDVNQVPTYTFDYAFSFDNPLDATTSRVGYTYLPSTKPIIHTSPYMQNCSIISFLGGNGVLIDGNLVDTPNTPPRQIEAENPVSGPAPEQGKSMVANAFTMVIFGGTGWRVINEAYSQLVSCFQIFALNGVYTQSGGYVSITNSATNFGIYALRSSGYSPNAFSFDKAYVVNTGSSGGQQTIEIIGLDRSEPVEEFVLRFYDPSNNDITNTYKPAGDPGDIVTFNAATAVNASTNIFTIASHGFTNGQAVIYDSNGNTPLGNLNDEQTYYVDFINLNEFRLLFDNSLNTSVDITATSTGSHRFLKNQQEFFVDEVIETHNTYQTLELSPGVYNFTVGTLITGTTGGNPNSAYVLSYDNDSTAPTLVVSVNKVTIGASTIRNVFDATSVITADHSSPTPVTNINVDSVSALSTKYSSNFKILSTIDGEELTGLGTLPGNQVWFHRPSIVNSSAHTWEYAGSGTDYNALPQNGGNTRAQYEQYNEPPGRVYTSGTNELGDFKVGNFITAFNRTGNITFQNKVSVDQLDALRLVLSDVEITSISTDVDLGDNETGGASDARLSTQRAIRSFMSNRLGYFIDKQVSTNAVPGAIVQLNTNGQINDDLIPATRAFQSSTVGGYKERLNQVDYIPAVDLAAGDITTEQYEQVELTLTAGVTCNDGDLISQTSSGMSGVVKGDQSNSTSVIVVSSTTSFRKGTIASVSRNGSNQATITLTTGHYFQAGDNIIINDCSDSAYNTAGTDVISTTFDTVTYANTGSFESTTAATGTVRNTFDTSGNITINSDSTPSTTNTAVQPTLVDNISEIYTNYFLRSAIESQYLVMDPAGSYTFTTADISTVARNGSNVATIVTTGNHGLVNGNRVKIDCSVTSFNDDGAVVTVTNSTTFTYSNTGGVYGTGAATGTVRSVVTAADTAAQGVVTEVRYGVCSNVDNTNITGGSNYIPTSSSFTWENVPLTPVSSSGDNATANITVTNGVVTNVDLIRGGTGYAVGDTLTANNSYLGGAGSGFEIEVLSIEKRAYIDIVGGELFVASSGSPDFVEDNNADVFTITLTDTIAETFDAGTDVDYVTDYRITISGHAFTSGDPVTYISAPNTAIGGMINGSVYYVKVINANTIELYEDYYLLNKIEFLSSSTGTHSLTVHTINLTNNSMYVAAHTFQTGDAFRINGNNLPVITSTTIEDGEAFFVGSVTTNSFTIHSLRSDALTSINGLTIDALDFTSKGTGSATLTKYNVEVTDVVNTSSNNEDNWNSLTASNIDASNIISGIISPSRLATGTANTETFLRGDSQWMVTVQTIKENGNSPITLSGPTDSVSFYGDVVIDIERTNGLGAGAFSSLGVASFLKSQFDVATDGSGEVFLKSGVVDAGTLDGFDSTYYLNPANLTSAVPVNKGGTNLTSYSTGDVIYAQSSGVLTTLAIGQADTVMTSTGTYPQWSTGLTMAKNISIASGELTTNNVGTAKLFDTNASHLQIGGEAETVTIGKDAASEAITGLLTTYTTAGSPSQTVTVNLSNTTANTTVGANNGATELRFASTSGIVIGMLVTGSASIQAGTTVIGLSATSVYLSQALTGSILSATTITFTNTPVSIGVKVGDQVTIASSTITNLDGTWPITSAGTTATSFNIATAQNVTCNNAAVAGTMTRNATVLIRNRTLVLGSAETSTSPVTSTIKGEDSYGSDIASGNLILQAGLGTGNSTGGNFIVKTGAVGSSGFDPQTATTRLTINTSGLATFANDVAITGDLAVNGADITTSSTGTANVFNTNALGLAIGGAATSVSIGAGSGTTTVNHNLTVGGNLTVNGTTTSVNSVVSTVVDPVIVIGATNPDPMASTTASATINGVTGATTTTATVSTSNVTGTIQTGQRITDAGGVLPVGSYVSNVSSGGGTTTITITWATAATFSTVSGSVELTLTGPVSDDNKDRGIVFRYNNATQAKSGFFGFDDTDYSFMYIEDATVNGEVVTGTLGTIKQGAVNIDGRTIIDTTEYVGLTAAAGVTTIDTFATATYRSAKFHIQITCTSGTDSGTYQASEYLVIHNGTDAFMTEYAVIKTGSNELATFTADVNSGNVRFRAQAAAGDTITIRVTKTLQTV